MKNPGDIPPNNPSERPKPNIQVTRLWAEDSPPHRKYAFEISASQEDIFAVLDSIRKAVADSTDQREIRELLSGEQKQLNFSVYRFYYDAISNKLTALVNGDDNVKKEYGPKLARFLEAFTSDV